MKYDNLLIGILAIVAGALVLWGELSISLVVGIFLIAWGVLTLIRRT